MTHLFDTNTWIRLADSPLQIAPGVRAQIAAMASPCGLSAISIWEVCLKFRRGRLQLSAALDDWLAKTLPQSLIQILPLDGKIARLTTELPGIFHNDPADRFVVATAILHGLTIVTSDE